MSKLAKIGLTIIGLVAVIALIAASLALSGGGKLRGGIYQALQWQFGSGLTAGAGKQLQINKAGVLYGGEVLCATSLGVNACSIQNNVGNMLVRTTDVWDGVGTTTIAIAFNATSTTPLNGPCKKLDGTACDASASTPSWQYGAASTTATKAYLHTRVATTSPSQYAVTSTSTPFTNTTDVILWRYGEYLNFGVITPVGIGGEVPHNGYFENATSSVFNRTFEAIYKVIATSTPSF